MQITHYCNSFIFIKIGKTKIACDPWVGTGSENAWLSYPIHNNGANILNNLNPNFIYISHLHCDHFDPNILYKFKNKRVKIIIKKFSNQRLKKKILQIGLKNIAEIEEWKKSKLSKDVTISIIPQMTSNSSELPEQINYDLDTSILIQSNHSKEIFFNNVDNPLSIKDLEKVKMFTKKNFSREIDVVCLPVGAAGEYPQCFLNVDREEEKKKIINVSLFNVKKQLNILKPKVFFQAGGTYTIFGKYSLLNKFIARPNTNRIYAYLRNKNFKTFDIEGGKTIVKKNGKWLSQNNINLNKNFDEKKIINKYLTKKYFYANKYKNTKITEIDNIYSRSCEKYHKILSNLQIKTNWKVEFFIYKNLSINKYGKINLKDSDFLKKYSLQSKKNHYKTFNQSFTELKCHLDFNLFFGLLKRKFVWNQPLAGSLILYERKPNKFDPNVIFSLNYLGI